MDEQMTDFQFKTFLKTILEILKSSNNLDEAIEKVESLLKN
jgi:hypothetical protein